ncbi:hypothetical protein CBR_g50020 [Chara braunii]|uniref:Rhamnogalacturonan lyase domain-containing protein n=1 Tax=Chara braunii TaxID=69332 RepID=A0A388K5D3_CHABU|nr:hypothetical protein CBR_g50020 [Chara braunii]|eukprot:GBG65229.1 hypothetical protein CBR_g50020 [Chara braunii]
MDRQFISSYIFVVFVIATFMGTLPDLAHTVQASSPQSDRGAVTVTEGSNYVLLSNGIVTVEFSRGGLLNESADANGDSDSNSTWSILDFPENLGSENFRTTSAPLVQGGNGSAGSAASGNRNPGGYYDMTWASCDGRECAAYERFSADEYRRITPESVTDRVEISFVQFPTKEQRGAPVKIDMRYVMHRGDRGFYSYLVLDHAGNDSTIHIGELRLVLRLNRDKFEYAALAHDRRRHMPGEIDRSPERSSKLAFKEARLLTNPVNPEFKYEFEHKYHYTADIKDMQVHGWVGPTSNPAVGMWLISPSRMEYMGGGPEKQDLTVQVGPIILNMLHSGHYGTPAVSILHGQAWRKTYGPYFFYVNGEPVCSSSSGEEAYHGCLWKDALSRAAKEESLWPYHWAVSSDYPGKGSRSSVSGTIHVEDPEWDKTTFGRGTDNSWVGLAAEGRPGTWAASSSGYQFWAKIQRNGHFHIPNVRPGSYSLFAYVHGVIGDFVLQEKVVVGSEGGPIDVGRKVIRPPRNGRTIWSIGIPNRSFGEFFVPVLNPRSQRPYPSTGPNSWRNYGSWLRYTEVYPDGDPVFHIDRSDYARDWRAKVPETGSRCRAWLKTRRR